MKWFGGTHFLGLIYVFAQIVVQDLARIVIDQPLRRGF